MNCPVCSKEITQLFVKGDLAWCDECRIAFSMHSLLEGDPEAYVQLKDASSCPRGVTYICDEQSETVSVRSFSFMGIPLALFSLFWLVLTVFSFTIHFGIALLMALVLFGMSTVAATAVFGRISLTFYPATGKIVYAKGPFRWLCLKRKFNGKDVVEIREGADGELPCPAIFLKNDKSFLLNFSNNDEKRMFLELMLDIFIARS